MSVVVGEEVDEVEVVDEVEEEADRKDSHNVLFPDPGMPHTRTTQMDEAAIGEAEAGGYLVKKVFGRAVKSVKSMSKAVLAGTMLKTS
jgi:4-hydroxy-3-methylbut-2-enyl diphosphate reductase IspH